ncbi:MAG: D-TA family PLP-dependent enzyme [Arcicella sp.]|nr:D-TA family PLP-dependent enzyme [Arcicella sp.]
MNWFDIKNIQEIDTPALLIYKERAEQNIEKAFALVHSVEQLRPHVKTHKLLEITEMMMKSGIYKFKCATIAEAEMLGMAKAKDVLIAYPVLGPKIKRLQALILKYPETKFSCLIDNIDTAKQLSNEFIEHKINVFIDLNVGMNRTGISVENALVLYKNSLNLDGINIIGLHAYDGHIHDTDVLERKHKAEKVFQLISLVQLEIEKFSEKKLKVVVGGTPTFSLHANAHQDVEVSPGTFIFWDAGYKNMMPDFDFLWAGIIATRIISIINKTHLCLDLGHKSIAAENPFPRINFLNNDEIIPISQSEEHLVVQVEDTGKYALGDVWYGVPAHICPTVALYNEVKVVENNEVINTWKVIARDRNITI